MLKFATFASDIELPFYASLASHKINHDMLDDSARSLLGLYEIRPSDPPEASCRLQVHGDALTNDAVPNGYYRAEGMIKNVNTIEEFTKLDKTAVLSQASRTVSKHTLLRIWHAIKDGTIFSCPSLLSTFFVICFADLKKYKFIYLFAFPALQSQPAWRVIPARPHDTAATHGEHTEYGYNVVHMTCDETSALLDSVQTWRYKVDSRQHGFFLAKKRQPKSVFEKSSAKRTQPPSSPEAPATTLGLTWEIGSLADYEHGFFDKVAQEDRYISFADPSTYPGYPGWMLRNLLVLIRHRWGLNRAQILCLRDVQARRDYAKSIVIRVEGAFTNPAQDALSLDMSTMPKATGWERNSLGRITNRIVNLGEYMDPQRLADQAVDLNLKLMKWRIAPTLNLEKIKSTKCLLLGAGTLGSYVARNLMLPSPLTMDGVQAWGVRHISFVDNGSVSFSNPVRQPLFNHKDCLGGGSKKAYRAAEALKEIYPAVNSEGFVVSVPMAGHPIMDEAMVRADFETLKRLIEEHDAIFLLMDTRESRWLPTLMGKAAEKVVMNAALGFDSFVVMRHGVKNQQNPEEDLGCYFCNDVVAPTDSISDRTLDQQCTVTRPGIAAIASALLVEILVSLLQHQQGALAPAPVKPSEDRGEHPLGIVPHQIRGFLADFRNVLVHGRSYDCCSACSDKVVDAYKCQGWKLVKKALNEKGYVEELSGLTEVQKAAEKALAEMQFAEEDGLDADEGELI
ncbi:MAG: hypothetical protein Q9163_004911 [Psora crenata]